MSYVPGSGNSRKNNNNNSNNWWSRQDPLYHGYGSSLTSSHPRPNRYLNQVYQPNQTYYHHKPHKQQQHPNHHHHQQQQQQYSPNVNPQVSPKTTHSGGQSNAYPASFPSDKVNSVTCGFCKHKLYINRELKGAWSPLLLPCGHVTCTNCETANPRRPCTVCPEQSIDDELRERLPHNVYVVGLLHAVNARPVHVEDPDMSFHLTSAPQSGPHVQRVCCSGCGMIPNIKCETCDHLYCKLCNQRIHQGALQEHIRTPLSINIADLPVSTVCPNHEGMPSEYYCEDCDFEGCSGCMIEDHKNHQTPKQVERNKEYLEEFQAAWERLQQSKWWMQQTKKKLKEEMACPELFKQSAKVEGEISRHFIYLHGILQNLEQQLKNQLRKQRSDHLKNIDEFTNRLTDQEEKLSSAIRVAIDVYRNNGQVDLKKFTEKLTEFANLPCHIIRKDDDDSDESIRLEMEDLIVERMKTHLQLHISGGRKFEIVGTNDLPEDYELDTPPPAESMSSIMESSIRSYSEKDALSMGLTMPSLSSSNVSHEEFHLDESLSANEGNKDLVIVTHIRDPQDFYVFKLSSTQALKEVNAEIERVVEADTSPTNELSLNQMYIVQRSEDLKWYRARLTNIDDKKRCEMFYVDYGWKETGVTADRIRNTTLPVTFHNSLAMHCTLGDIAPRDGEWTDEALTRFKDMVSGYQFTMHILINRDPIYTVDLTGEHLNGVSVQKWLLDTKLAKSHTYYKLQRMNPLSAHQFYTEKLKLEKYHDAIVSHVESPSCLYVTKPPTSEDLHQLHSFYQEYAKYLESDPPPLKNPEYGTTVALHDPPVWRRGYITNVDADEKKIDVFLVDNGRTVTVRYSDVSLLPSRFCRYSAQAIRISLAEIAPLNNDKWSDDAIEYLKKHLENQKVEVLPLKFNDEKYEAFIFHKDNLRNMSSNLAAQGFALETGISARNMKANKGMPIMSKSARKRMANFLKSGDGSRETTKEIHGKKKSDKVAQSAIKKKSVEDSDPYKAQVIINRVVSPYDIYVSMAHNVREYTKMMSKMQEFYQENHGTLEGDLSSDIIYCIYSPKDMRFCRAQFLGMSEDDPTVAKMSLIDLGQVENIPVDAIQPLKKKFLKVPRHMFKIRLAGIRPCGDTDKWPSTSCGLLNDILHDTGDIKYYITVVDAQDEDETVPVNLYIRRNVITGPTQPNRKETISVSQKLKDEGLALPVRGHVDGRELAIELKKKLQLEPIGEIMNQESNCFETIVKCETQLDSIIEDENEKEDDDENEKENDNEIPIEESNDAQIDNAWHDDSSESIPAMAKRSGWIPAIHLKEEEFNAEISYVDDGCYVYFHPDTEEYNRTLDYISSTLDKHYTNRTIEPQDREWEVGDSCIANYHADKKWYRAVVRGIDKNGSLKVEFVDYGNLELCPIGTVVKKIVLEHIPIQATKATLVGLRPEGRVWKTDHLDVIHNAIVSKKLKVKVHSKPPDPWKIAAWLIDGISLIPVPWYIKNKTQVPCITDTISLLPGDERFVEESESLNVSHENITLPSIPSINFNGNSRPMSTSLDSDDTTADASLSLLNQSFNEEESFKEDFSETLRNQEDLYANSIIVMNKFGPPKCNGTSNSPSDRSDSKSSPISTLSSSSLKKAFSRMVDSQRSLLECNGNNGSFDSSSDDNIACKEAVISGHSVYLNINTDDVDIGSVKSEALFNDENIIPSSTPLNTSISDDFEDLIPGEIDLKRYGINRFKMTIGQQIDYTYFSGCLIETKNEEVDDWIRISRIDQAEIQELALEQPVLSDVRVGQCCITKYTDGSWYRAVIINIYVAQKGQNQKVAEIEFLDYGNTQMISNFTRLRTCKKRWLKVPRMCVKFYLSNVKQVEGHEGDTQQLMSEIFGPDQVLFAKVKKYDPCLELDIFASKQSKKLVYAEIIEKGHLELVD